MKKINGKLNIVILIICTIFALCSFVACNSESEKDAHEHTFSRTVVEPTCQEKGYTILTCECGYTKKTAYTDVVDHEYKNGKCARCSALQEFEIEYFDLRGQQNDNPSSFTIEDEFRLESLESSKEWRFGGWFDENGNRVTHIFRGTQKSVVLTAQWLAHIDMHDVVFNDATFVYDGESHGIYVDESRLPSSCTVEYIDNVATNAGEYMATAQFYIDGEYAGEKTAKLTIEKAPFDFGDTCLEPQTFVYDGKPKKLTVTSSVVGAKITYYNQTATDVGEHVVKAVMSYDDGNSFGELVLESTLTITKATYDMSNVVFADKTFDYDGHAKGIVATGLPKGVQVSYDRNSYVDAGEYLITATFVGDEKNYNPIPQQTATLIINKGNYDLGKITYSFSPCDYYTGETHTPIAIGLTDDVSVSFDYEGDCVDAGEYTFIAKFSVINQNYNPISDQQFTLKIKKATIDMSNVVFANDTVTYDGNTHGITATNLPDGVSVTYSPNNCKNAGVYQIVAHFTADANNYNAIPDMSAKLTVKKATYDLSGVVFSDTELVYDGNKKSFSVDNLPVGVKAIYEFEEINAGTYEFVVSFEGDADNYNAIPDKNVTITIEKATVDMSAVEFSDETHTYSGASFSLTAKNLPSCVTVSYENNGHVSAGEYVVIAHFAVDEKNYNPVDNMSATLTIEVAEYDVSEMKFESATFVYDGNEKRIYVTNLPADIIVTYSPENCVAVGEYLITASFEVDETKYAPIDDMTATLTIEKATYDTSAVIFENKTFKYDGLPKNLEIVNVPNGVEFSFDVTDVVEIGKYTVTATFEVDTDCYNAILPMTATLEIEKGSYDQSKFAFADKTVVYDGTAHYLEVIGVPDGVEVSYDNNGKMNAGEYTVTAHFAVDETHYNVIADMTAKLTINKATYDMSGVKYENTSATYDGNAKTFAVVGLPEGVSATIASNPTNAGTYDISVSFASEDANYNAIPDATVRFVIAKATIDMSGVTFASLTTVYDGTEKSIVAGNLPEGVSASYKDNCATNAGTYSAVATFTYADTQNYNAIPSKSATLTIQKRQTTATIVGEKNIIHDGNAHKDLTATFDNVVSGDTVTYQFAYSGDMIDVGDYTATVSVTNNNYVLTGTTTCALTIYMAHYFDCVFPNTDEYLYVVGNGNNISLSSLFKAVEGETINSADVNVTVAPITGNVTCTVTKNATTWTSGTLKFVNTGVVTVSISQQGRGQLNLNLEVVSANNATTYSQVSGNVVFLNDIVMSDNGSRSFSNATVYGNGFTFDVTKGTNSAVSGIIYLSNSHLNNLKIIAAVYPNISTSVGTEYFSSAVQTTGTSSITNCYIANARFCIRAFSGNLTITDTVLDGGRYGNMFITGGAVNVHNLTTINMPRDGVCGVGILFDNSGTNDMRLNISGDFKQYNWLAKNGDKKYFDGTDLSSFFSMMFGNSYSDIHFSYNGDTYANAAIGSLKDGLSASAVTGLPSYYKTYNVSSMGLSGFVMCNDKNKYTLNASSFNAPEFECNRVPSKPTYQYTGPSRNASGNIPVSYDKGDNFEFDMRVLTAKKFGYNLTVVPTVNGVEYSNGIITLNAIDSYKFDIVFKVTDPYVFGADGVQLNPVVYDVVYTVEVNVIKNIQPPTFTFKDKDGKTYSATTVTVGNETYIVPDTDTGYSQTVAGVKINCVLVDGSRVKKIFENTVYHYFPFFNGVTIQDYDEDGNVVTTINSSTTTQPSTIDVISKIGNTGSTTGSLSQLTATKYDKQLCLEGNGSGSTTSNEEITTVYFKYKYTANNGNVYYYYVAYAMGKPKTSL